MSRVCQVRARPPGWPQRQPREHGIIRGFGPAAQAGFGIGARVMQALFLPVVALAFAVSPVVGQNFGGRRADRVRHTAYAALGLATGLMLVLAAVAYFAPTILIRGFSKDPTVIAFGGEYMRIVSFNFVAAGVVFTASSTFQGIGNTLPPLLSSMTRLIVFALPAALLARTPGFQIKYIWSSRWRPKFFRPASICCCSAARCEGNSFSKKCQWPRWRRAKGEISLRFGFAAIS